METRSAVVLIVCNLRDPVETQRKQLWHWLRFVCSCSAPNDPPRVAIVGTHRGADPATGALGQLEVVDGRWHSQELEECVDALAQRFRGRLDLADEFFYIESLVPSELDLTEIERLQRWLSQAFSQIGATRRVPEVCMDVAEAIEQTVRTKLPAIARFADVLTAIGEANPRIDVSNPARVRAVLGNLSETGTVIYFEDVGDTVVIDPQAFGVYVIGRIFCPYKRRGFQGIAVDESNGFLFRQSALERCLQQARDQGHIFGDVDHVIQLLDALELIIPMPAHEGGDGEACADPADPLFAVPGRLSHAVSGGCTKYANKPEGIWGPPPPQAGASQRPWQYLGVRLELASPLTMIPPSAMPRLQHRLSRRPRFRMWRHGLFVCEYTAGGEIQAEALVVVSPELEYMDVCVRGPPAHRTSLGGVLTELVRLCEQVDVALTCSLLDTASVMQHNEAEHTVARKLTQPPCPDVGSPVLPSTCVAECLSPSADRGTGLRIFISYASRDSADVFALLASACTARMHTVFEPINFVNPSKAEMRAEAAQADVLVAVLSPSYFESEWCCAEAEAAWNAGVTIIPVYNGDKHHYAPGQDVMSWRDMATEHSTQELRSAVYRGNVVRVVDTQNQTGAINDFFDKLEARYPGAPLPLPPFA